MSLTNEEFGSLEQGDLVLYVSGTSEEDHIEAEALVDEVDDETGLVQIILKNIKFQGRNSDRVENEYFSVYQKELTLMK